MYIRKTGKPHSAIARTFGIAKQTLVAIIMSLTLMLSGVTSMLLSLHAGATAAGEYEWTQSTGKDKGFEGDAISWTGVASSADGMKLAAVANNQYIHTSTDGGATWTAQTGSGKNNWGSITSSADGTKLAATLGGPSGGAGGYIYTSADSGVTWTQQTAAGNRLWKSIASSADGTKLAVATDDYIYTSADSGATWTKRTASGVRLWRAIASSADGTKLVAVPSYGYVYTSADSGETWTEQTGTPQRNWYAIASSADGTKLVAGTSLSYIYTSTDAGATWTQQTTSGSRSWNSVTISDDGANIAAGSSGYIYTSTDAGATWTARVTDAIRSWRSIASSADGRVLLAGSNQTSSNVYAYISEDYGVTWQQRQVIGGGSWPGAAMSDDCSTMVLAGGNSIYISTDLGATWTKQTAAGGRAYRAVASSADGSKLVAAVYGGHIYTAAIAPVSLGFTPTTDTSAISAPSSSDVSNPQVITNTRPTFSGVTYAGGAVKVTVNSDPIICTTTADSDGNWSCTLPSDIPAGVHTVTIELFNPTTGTTETMGPYYIEVTNEGATIDNGDIEAPNTGVNLGSNKTIGMLLVGGIMMLLSVVVYRRFVVGKR